MVFLGGGRITSAMLAGLRLQEHNYRLMVHDHHPANWRRLRKQFGVAIETNLHKAVALADVLIIAVRPASVRELLSAIGTVAQPFLAISLAAGVPLKNLQRGLKSPVRWARAMPSPACRGGYGLTAVTFPRSLAPRDRMIVHDLFASFGQVVEIPENKFDAFTVVYSCSHGYHAMATLMEAGQAAGLDRKSAQTAAAHALADGINAWRKGTESLESLLEEAATPGGIAATTMAGMNEEGFAHAVRAGVRAGLARTRANARA